MEKLHDIIGKSLFCIKTDKAYGIKKDSYYKITGFETKYNVDYYILDVNGISTGFKEGTMYFLSVKDSLNKIRYMKFEKIAALQDDEEE